MKESTKESFLGMFVGLVAAALVGLFIILLTGCETKTWVLGEETPPVSAQSDPVDAEPFTVDLDLWLECRTMCGGAGTNWAVNEDFCICKRGIQFRHRLSKHPNDPFDAYVKIPKAAKQEKKAK